MNTRSKKFLIIGLVILTIGIFGACSIFSSPKIDSIELEENKEIISKYPDIVNQYTYFQHNGFIELYEFTDNSSYLDTIINLYFTKEYTGDEKTAEILSAIDAYICDIRVEDLEYENFYLLYYYGLLTNKYHLPISDALRDGLYKYENYYDANFNSALNIGDLNRVYMLQEIFELLEMKSNNDILEKMIDEIDISTLDELSVKSFEIIKCCKEKKDDQIQKSILKTIDEYCNKKYDLDTLIIYLNLYDDKYIKLIDSELIDTITEYCIDKYCTISSNISFAGFKISWLYNQEVNDLIMEIFLNKPQNEDGFVPKVAQIIPTYRRIFQYSEICHVLGITLCDADVYEICGKVDSKNLMNDDYYYQSLIARNYPDMEIDIDGLNDAIVNAENNDVTLFNYFSYFYLIKAGMLNDIDCTNLIQKLQEFDDLNETDAGYLVKDVCDEQISYIYSKNDHVDFSTQIEDFSGEGEIETYYQYAVYMKESSKKCPEEIKQKIDNAISNYFIKNDHGGGFFMNSEFKYNDIAQTYKCLFLKDFILT